MDRALNAHPTQADLFALARDMTAAAKKAGFYAALAFKAERVQADYRDYDQLRFKGPNADRAAKWLAKHGLGSPYAPGYGLCRLGLLRRQRRLERRDRMTDERPPMTPPETEWQSIIARAKRARACQDGLEWARQYKTLKQAAQSDKAPDYFCWFSVHAVKGPWPPGEAAIAREPRIALEYAGRIIRGPWPLGEAAIATDPRSSLYYARRIIRGPWPLGEEAISRHSHTALDYAKRIIKGPWPRGEAAIANHCVTAIEYARSIIRGPWPPGEAAIATHPVASLKYARRLIQGPWPPGEEAIAIDHRTAREYSELLANLQKGENQ